MSEKRSKYDTDPLDPDFVRQTDDMWGATGGVEPRPTNEVGDASAAEMPPSAARMPPPSEAPTQRMDEKFAQSYPSIFIPPTYAQPPTPYQQPPNAYQQPPPQYQQPY